MPDHPFHDTTLQRRILIDGTREEIIEWLVWNDLNGTFTDQHSIAEGMPALTLEAARRIMADVLARG